jgi:hypothetical protein
MSDASTPSTLDAVLTDLGFSRTTLESPTGCWAHPDQVWVTVWASDAVTIYTDGVQADLPVGMAVAEVAEILRRAVPKAVA